MRGFRNGKAIIVCDGCYKTIKRPKPQHSIDIAGREAHAHGRCVRLAHAKASKYPDSGGAT